MKVYIAVYNPCIYESAWETISVHSTEAGAQDALNSFRENEEKSYKEMCESAGESYKGLPKHVMFDVRPYNVLL